MRILSVQFSNLNSLAGDWCVDFSHPEYLSHGIFSITGPTGAGKSTILDAICLALYAKTPRLPVVSASSNEVMTRQTSACHAEVVFETSRGRYACVWRQHRARRQIEGALQPPLREMFQLPNGDGVVKGSAVSKQVVAVTGLDYEQFVRSTLLAQGGFAAFLNAKANERAPLLEQITGTEIYSRISIETHLRKKTEDATLQTLQNALQGIAVLSDEDICLLRAQQTQIQRALDTFAPQMRERQQQLHWRTQILDAEQAQMVLNAQWCAFVQKKNQAQEDLERYRWAQKARAIEPAYAQFSAVEHIQQADNSQLQRQTQRLAQLAQVQTRAQASRDALLAQLHTLQHAQHTQADLFKTVRALDVQMQALRLPMDEMQVEVRQRTAQLADDQRLCTQLQSRYATVLQQCEAQFNAAMPAQRTECENWLAQLQQAIAVCLERRSLPQWRQEARTLEVRQQCLSDVRQALAMQTQMREEQLVLQQTITQNQQTLQADTQQLAQLEKDQALRNRLLTEMRRTQALLSQVQDLAAHRAQLTPGQACPLCGALTHPFVEEGWPQVAPPEADRCALEAELAAIGTEKMTLNRRQAGCEQAIADAQRGRDKLESACKRQAQTIVSTLQTLAVAEQDLSAKVQACQDQQTHCARVIARVEQLQADHAALLQCTQESAQIAHTLHTQRDLCATSAQALQTLTEKCAGLQQTQREKQSARANLFAGDPDQAEQHLAQQLTDVRRELAIENDSLSRASSEQDTVQAEIQHLQTAIAQRCAQLETVRHAYQEELQQAGFVDVQAFHAARLAQAQWRELVRWAEDLAREEQDYVVKLSEKQSDLNRLNRQALTALSLEELRTAQTQQEMKTHELQQTLGVVAERLATHQVQMVKHAEKWREIEAQKKSCARWDRLHQIIGSAKGDVFRNFAQGLTFDTVIYHANEKLKQMSDRYILVRHAELPLELNLIDQYHANERRSTKNLSGGESFLVSLALSLGLASISSRNIQVDSLFLDEGFGALDEQALDLALETINGLRQDGKLIGIISHIPALKARIPCQIEVQPQAGGVSVLVGPGVSQRGTESSETGVLADA